MLNLLLHKKHVNQYVKERLKLFLKPVIADLTRNPLKKLSGDPASSAG